jgi:hypothetical protein
VVWVQPNRGLGAGSAGFRFASTGEHQGPLGKTVGIVGVQGEGAVHMPSRKIELPPLLIDLAEHDVRLVVGVVERDGPARVLERGVMEIAARLAPKRNASQR